MALPPTIQPETPPGTAANAARPANVADLLIEGEVSPTWVLDNKTSNRFFLLNIRPVMAEIGLDESKYDDFFHAAEEAIKTYGWAAQHGFPYSAHYTQISRKNYSKAKRFGHAVTCIVALDLAAQTHKPDFNVYDQLRILSAQFFVDRLTPERLGMIEKHYNAMSPEDKKAVGGGKDMTFEDVFLEAIAQVDSTGLAKYLAQGFCATRFTCEKILSFVNDKFATRDPRLAVGPVRAAGDPNTHSEELGTRNAVLKLRVPKTWDPTTFPGTAAAPAPALAGNDDAQPASDEITPVSKDDKKESAAE